MGAEAVLANLVRVDTAGKTPPNNGLVDFDRGFNKFVVLADQINVIQDKLGVGLAQRR